MNRRELITKAPILAGVVTGVVEVPKKARGIIVTIKDDYDYEDGDPDERRFDTEIKSVIQEAFGTDMKVVIIQGADVQVVN